MGRQYPRRYVVVEDGKFERVTVKDPVQEAAVMLQHAEALGLNRPKPFDLSRDIIPDADQAREE